MLVLKSLSDWPFVAVGNVASYRKTCGWNDLKSGKNSTMPIKTWMIKFRTSTRAILRSRFELLHEIRKVLQSLNKLSMIYFLKKALVQYLSNRGLFRV